MTHRGGTFKSAAKAHQGSCLTPGFERAASLRRRFAP